MKDIINSMNNLIGQVEFYSKKYHLAINESIALREENRKLRKRIQELEEKNPETHLAVIEENKYYKPGEWIILPKTSLFGTGINVAISNYIRDGKEIPVYASKDEYEKYRDSIIKSGYLEEDINKYFKLKFGRVFGVTKDTVVIEISREEELSESGFDMLNKYKKEDFANHVYVSRIVLFKPDKDDTTEEDIVCYLTEE